MALPQYIKDAQNNYNAKFDIIQLKLPKGTKERIKEIIGKDDSMTAYCKQAVLRALESDENLQKIPTQEAETELTNAQVEEVPQEQETAEYKPITAEQNAEFLRMVAEKKAEQDRKAEELQKQKEEQEKQEQEERQAEIMEHLEKLRNGEAPEEDEEKAQARAESIAKAGCPF